MERRGGWRSEGVRKGLTKVKGDRKNYMETCDLANNKNAIGGTVEHRMVFKNGAKTLK